MLTMIKFQPFLTRHKRHLGRFLRDIVWRYFWVGYFATVVFMLGLRVAMSNGIAEVPGNLLRALLNTNVQQTSLMIGLDAAFLAGSIYVAVIEAKRLWDKYDKDGNLIRTEAKTGGLTGTAKGE